MVNFGLLTAEICWRVWGTPGNFNGFRVLAWHSSSGRQPNFAALNRGRHLYPAGRPSRWALAHISSSIFFFLAESQPSQIGCLPYLDTCGPSANVECRSEKCCTPHWKCSTQKPAKKSPSGYHRTTLSVHIFATMARIDNRKKSLLSSNISSTCPHNMVNFGPLAAEIDPVVWGTPANFNGFRVLAALLHCTVLQQWASAKLCGVEQRSPPIFSRAAITLGIGPHF